MRPWKTSASKRGADARLCAIIADLWDCISPLSRHGSFMSEFQRRMASGWIQSRDNPTVTSIINPAAIENSAIHL